MKPYINGKPNKRPDKMTLNKAIEILDDYNRYGTVLTPIDPDLTAAINLGKEALKRVRDERLADLIPLPIPLPGETEN